MNNWKGSDLRYKIYVDVLLHQTCNRKMWAMSKLRATQRRCFHVICSFLYARKRDVLRKGRSAKKDRLRLRPIAFLSFDSPSRRFFLMNLLTSLLDAIHLSSKFAKVFPPVFPQKIFFPESIQIRYFCGKMWRWSSPNGILISSHFFNFLKWSFDY